MDRLWIFIAGGIFGAIGVLLFYHRKDGNEDDGEIMIQNLIDKVDDIIEDIKKTV